MRVDVGIYCKRCIGEGMIPTIEVGEYSHDEEMVSEVYEAICPMCDGIGFVEEPTPPDTPANKGGGVR